MIVIPAKSTVQLHRKSILSIEVIVRDQTKNLLIRPTDRPTYLPILFDTAGYLQATLMDLLNYQTKLINKIKFNSSHNLTKEKSLCTMIT